MIKAEKIAIPKIFQEDIDRAVKILKEGGCSEIFLSSWLRKSSLKRSLKSNRSTNYWWSTLIYWNVPNLSSLIGALGIREVQARRTLDRQMISEQLVYLW